jgi:hypothetical protein
MPDYGDVFTVQEFMEGVRDRLFMDYDGTGYAAKLIEGQVLLSSVLARPSRIHEIPEDATHIAWFNK